MSVISRQFTLEASSRAAHTGSCALYSTGHALSCTFGERKGPPAVGSGSNSNGPVIRSHKPCLPSKGRSGPVIPSLASRVAKTGRERSRCAFPEGKLAGASVTHRDIRNRNDGDGLGNLPRR